MSKKVWIPLSIILFVYVVLMVIFTFYDYQITDNLYHLETPFGIIGEILGPMFMPYVMIYSIISLIVFISLNNVYKRVLVYIGLLLSFIYVSFIGVMTAKYSYASWRFVPSIVLYSLLTIFTIAFNLKLKKKSSFDQKKYISYLLAAFFICLVSLLGIDIIKCIFGRVRYDKLLSEEDFKPWFYINKFEFNSSFPSGHASRSMASVAFSLIPLYFGKKKTAYTVILITTIFSITISISRLYEGQHYPSDILTGGLLVFVAYYLSTIKVDKLHFDINEQQQSN